MKRKLIIFGNGLGMALDPQHFSLSKALFEVWNMPTILSEQQKQLIERCLNRNGAPSSEDELDTLHQAITHCKALDKIGKGNAHWLSQDGQNFPKSTSLYLHKVATKLHEYNGALPDLFEEKLISFVKSTKSHVATLNYDKLLYNSFINNNIFNGFDGYLVDGMLNRGFSSEALERKYGKAFGFYLHLHGSPLFINSDQEIVKLSRDELTMDANIIGDHIVLTHVKNKPAVIAASHALSTYWEYLHFALSEANEVILFGYSGLDEHLNIILRPYLKERKCRVVEWSGAGNISNRKAFWYTTLGHQVDFCPLKNITDFNSW